jgi:hypothetical protein
MGILEDKLKSVETWKDSTIRRVNSSVPQGSNNTADDILQDEDEVERLSRYIDPEEQKKIINVRTGVKHGVEKIGSVNDKDKKLRKLLSGASKKAKRFEDRIYARKWARSNLTEKIVTKSGKEISGRMISKNVYIKEVSFWRAGKNIKYLQARNIKTGRVVSYKAAASLLGKAKI